MTIPFSQLYEQLKSILLHLAFPENKAHLCAHIFASNSLDGVYSHGLNRFPVFVKHIKQGLTNPLAEPELIEDHGPIQTWDGHLAPGMYNATICTDHAIALAKTHGISCVTIKKTNHWMRGGTYGWQAADAGCIGICFTNAIAGMPAWGGLEPVLGNNPLVIAVPRPRQDGGETVKPASAQEQGRNNSVTTQEQGTICQYAGGHHVVLDMAMSQYSYGKLQEYELKNEPLPITGGYDEQGNLSTDPAAIRKTKRLLPAGYWKGSGLAMLLDILLVALSGGRSTPAITASGHEYGVTQCFICIHRPDLHTRLTNEILNYVKSSTPVTKDMPIAYPGERTLMTRLKNEKHGIPVDERIWNEVLALS